MSKWLKYALVSAGVLALGIGGVYAMNVNSLKEELEVELKVLVHNVTLTGLVLRLYILIKNPTAGHIKVKYPFIELVHEGKTVASSTPKDIDFPIDKFGKLDIPGKVNGQDIPAIDISLGFVRLATTAPNLLKQWRDKGLISVKVRTLTRINGVKDYKDEQDITIGEGETSNA